MWDVIAHSYPDFNVGMGEKSHPLLLLDVINYACLNLNVALVNLLIKEAPGTYHTIEIYAWWSECAST